MQAGTTAAPRLSWNARGWPRASRSERDQDALGHRDKIPLTSVIPVIPVHHRQAFP